MSSDLCLNSMWKARFPEIQFAAGRRGVTLRAASLVTESLRLSATRKSSDFSRNTQRYDLETRFRLSAAAGVISGWGAPGDRFPMDVAYTQAFTNLGQVGEVRNPESASYGLRWIDRLQELADSGPVGARSAKRPCLSADARGMCIGLILISKFMLLAAETCTRHGDSNHGVQIIEERIWRIVQSTDSEGGAVKRACCRPRN